MSTAAARELAQYACLECSVLYIPAESSLKDKQDTIRNVALELNCGCFINEKKKNICGEERYRYPYKPFWDIAKKEGKDNKSNSFFYR